MKAKQVSIFALGPVGNGVLGVIVVPTLSWLFSPADIGRFYVLQMTVSLVVILAYLGLDQAYVREYHESRDRASLLKATFVPVLIMFVAVLLLAIPFGDAIGRTLFDLDSSPLFWILLGCAFASIVSRQLALLLRMSGRAGAFAASQLLPRSVLLLVLAGLAVAPVTPTFQVLAGAQLAATTSIMVAYVFITRRDWMLASASNTSKVPRRRLLRFGLPLMMASLAYWGLTAVSVVALRALSDLEELGVYSVAVSVAGVAAVIQGVFSLIWAPVVYRWVANEVDMSRLGGITRQVALVIAAMFTACGSFSWTLDYVLPAEYDAVKYLLPGALVTPLISTLSDVTGIGISIARRTSYTLLSTAVALAVGITLNLALVGPLGADGAVIANAVAFAVYFICRTELSAFLWRGFPRLAIYAVVVLAVTFSIFTVAFGADLGRPAVVLLWIFFGCLIAFLLRRDLGLSINTVP